MPTVSITWQSMADERCPICQMLDGYTWTFTTGEGGGIPSELYHPAFPFPVWTTINGSDAHGHATVGATRRIPQEMRGVTFYSSNDEWQFIQSDNPRICEICLGMDGDVFRGDELRTRFFWHVIVDVNSVYPKVHPNCGCSLVRVYPVETVGEYGMHSISGKPKEDEILRKSTCRCHLEISYDFADILEKAQDLLRALEEVTVE